MHYRQNEDDNMTVAFQDNIEQQFGQDTHILTHTHTNIHTYHSHIHAHTGFARTETHTHKTQKTSRNQTIRTRTRPMIDQVVVNQSSP